MIAGACGCTRAVLWLPIVHVLGGLFSGLNLYHLGWAVYWHRFLYLPLPSAQTARGRIPQVDLDEESVRAGLRSKAQPQPWFSCPNGSEISGITLGCILGMFPLIYPEAS